MGIASRGGRAEKGTTTAQEWERTRSVSTGKSVRMSVFDEQSLAIVAVLSICTCTYVRARAPSLVSSREGFRGILWKAARIGERLSPWVGLVCIAAGIGVLLR